MARHKNQTKGPSQRQLSVGEEVRHGLSAILGRHEIDDPLLEKAVISVSEVRMSPDLKLATAYVTAFGQDDMEPAVAALNRHARYLRGRLSPMLRGMKYMPEVRFRADESFDNYARIDRLLRSPEVARDLDDDTDEDGN
ncbi:30S ribosome-binding factor RbfA [Aureimonas leprariae]|uniref:Ribosome-binding factor A n=1 Tax=Plantimonas leprariae TaxID=2615207 RepID=A0A7V7PTA4_9HYPH|nr:30S ribosome-binding factor RbfA [Aureimonas leprariae]KAB0682843.1 30S ribosome-binding factor RbfA [Aureimonas leprariae]